MKLPRLPRFTAGAKAIKASDLNAMSDAIKDLWDIIGNASGGPGIDVSVNAGGLLIALLGPLKDRLVTVKITAAPTPRVALLPSACTYSYSGIDKKISDDNVTPIYGRPVTEDDCAIYPAKVGHLAFIFRNPQGDGNKKAELWILTETPARGPCTG